VDVGVNEQVFDDDLEHHDEGEKNEGDRHRVPNEQDKPDVSLGHKPSFIDEIV
jgi:hypothetical protein